MLALAVFGPAFSAACADEGTPPPADEASTEDGVDADLVPGDAGNGANTDPGDSAPAAQVGGDGTDEEDTVSEEDG
jgi:hypothetical protein